jgi:dihydropteroate synthase
MDHVLFLTGRLAEPALRRVLGGIDSQHGPAPFTWEVRELGVQVAALMTTDMVARRLPTPVAAQRVVLPGRCRGDIEKLATVLNVPVHRGPEELKDLPRYLEREAAPIALDEPGTLIFAEIVDAPRLTVQAIVERARALSRDGADVIDLGCLPQEPYAHLEDSVRALKSQGFAVSVDSMNADELLRGGKAGADYLLSLTADNAWIADEVSSTPVLIAREPQDEASLWSLIERFDARGRTYLADSILDPIPFGFTASIVRYQRLRERFARAPIMIGVGNLTELTEADTSGINALLAGVAAELKATAILTTQVSAHARRAVREADHARRIMHAAVSHRMLPKGLSDALMTVHAKRPFPDTDDEIAGMATQVRDPNFRIQVTAGGLHVYNRDGLRRGTDPFALWPTLKLEDDAAHAFYMGVELARAQTAWQLGKRYVQDQPLDWGAAYEATPQDVNTWCAPGTTMTHRKPAEPAAQVQDTVVSNTAGDGIPSSGGDHDKRHG